MNLKFLILFIEITNAKIQTTSLKPFFKKTSIAISKNLKRCACKIKKLQHLPKILKAHSLAAGVLSASAAGTALIAIKAQPRKVLLDHFIPDLFKKDGSKHFSNEILAKRIFGKSLQLKLGEITKFEIIDPINFTKINSTSYLDIKIFVPENEVQAPNELEYALNIDDRKIYQKISGKYSLAKFENNEIFYELKSDEVVQKKIPTSIYLWNKVKENPKKITAAAGVFILGAGVYYYTPEIPKPIYFGPENKPEGYIDHIPDTCPLEIYICPAQESCDVSCQATTSSSRDLVIFKQDACHVKDTCPLVPQILSSPSGLSEKPVANLFNQRPNPPIINPINLLRPTLEEYILRSFPVPIHQPSSQIEQNSIVVYPTCSVTDKTQYSAITIKNTPPIYFGPENKPEGYIDHIPDTCTLVPATCQLVLPISSSPSGLSEKPVANLFNQRPNPPIINPINLLRPTLEEYILRSLPVPIHKPSSQIEQNSVVVYPKNSVVVYPTCSMTDNTQYSAINIQNTTPISNQDIRACSEEIVTPCEGHGICSSRDLFVGTENSTTVSEQQNITLYQMPTIRPENNSSNNNTSPNRVNNKPHQFNENDTCIKPDDFTSKYIGYTNLFNEPPRPPLQETINYNPIYYSGGAVVIVSGAAGGAIGKHLKSKEIKAKAARQAKEQEIDEARKAKEQKIAARRAREQLANQEKDARQNIKQETVRSANDIIRKLSLYHKNQLEVEQTAILYKAQTDNDEEGQVQTEHNRQDTRREKRKKKIDAKDSLLNLRFKRKVDTLSRILTNLFEDYSSKDFKKIEPESLNNILKTILYEYKDILNNTFPQTKEVSILADLVEKIKKAEDKKKKLVALEIKNVTELEATQRQNIRKLDREVKEIEEELNLALELQKLNNEIAIEKERIEKEEAIKHATYNNRLTAYSQNIKDLRDYYFKLIDCKQDLENEKIQKLYEQIIKMKEYLKFFEEDSD